MQNLTVWLNRRLFLIIVLTVTIVPGIVFNRATIVAANSDDEAAARAALLQSATAFEKNDIAALNKLWANDEALTVFESGHANYGWTDYRDHHLVPEMREMKNTKYTLSDIKLHMAGKTAWATFKYAISADLKDRHVDGGGLGTAVLEERDGQWQILHWHSSAPRRQPASAPTPARKG